MDDRDAVRQRFGVCAGAAFRAAVGLAAVLVSPAAWAATTSVSGEGYVQECRAAGVPEPPSFNYEDAFHNRPNNKWIYNGILDTTFAGGGNQTAEVFYYDSRSDPDDPTNPPGLCIALPRSVFPAGQTPDEGPPDRIALLGVICQGQQTGKACFWDNGDGWLNDVGIPGGVDPFWTLQFGDGPRNTHFVGGAVLGDGLGGNCSNCHQGENAFIVHPGTALDIDARWPDVWHEPIFPAGWKENPGPFPFAPTRTDDCLFCHNNRATTGRFPLVSIENRDFCSSILAPVTGPNGTMPTSGAPLTELLDACDEPPLPELSPMQQMMSFEGPAQMLWSTQLGTLSDVTNNVREGDAAMSVNASGYVRLDSLSFSTWELPVRGTRLDLDVYVPPSGQPNKYWLGSVQLFITIPSAQIVNSFVGQVEFTPKGTGWRTTSFTLPQQVRTALAQQHTDVRFGIAINTPQGAPPVVLDYLRFAGTLSMPPAPPPLVTQYDFERGGVWESYDGAVASSGQSGEVSYLGASSLKVNLSGSSAGRVFTQPVTSPAPGTTISYRVYIPNGTPVSAVQPYVADANWVWSHSYNTNLPWGAWMTLTVVVPQGVTLPLREIGVKFYLSAPHTGPVYVDAIQW